MLVSKKEDLKIKLNQGEEPNKHPQLLITVGTSPQSPPSRSMRGLLHLGAKDELSLGRNVLRLSRAGRRSEMSLHLAPASSMG